MTKETIIYNGKKTVSSKIGAGTSRYRLSYIEYTDNKVLLYSTGNCIQYSVINHNGKEYEKEYI